MDDFKLFASKDKKLAKQLKLVKQYSDDIQIEFGLNKCAKFIFIQGRPTKMDNIKIDLNTTMQELCNEASCKYLGVEEGHQTCHKKCAKQLPTNTCRERG